MTGFSKYYCGVHGFIEIPSFLLRDSDNTELVPFSLNCKTQKSNIIFFTAQKKKKKKKNKKSKITVILSLISTV